MDVVMLRGVKVLGLHRNAYQKDGQEKCYRTLFAYLDAPENGKDKPQLLEISVEDDETLDYLRPMVKKTCDFVAEKQTYRDGSARYKFMGTLAEFLKGSGSFSTAAA